MRAGNVQGVCFPISLHYLPIDWRDGFDVLIRSPRWKIPTFGDTRKKKKKNAHAYTHARADLKKKVINRELYKAPHSPRSLLKAFDQEVLRFHINGWIPFRDHAKRTATWGGFGLL